MKSELKSEPKISADKQNTIWMEHDCNGVVRVYSLPRAVYEVVSSEPVTISQIITCGLCDLRGRVTNGVWTQV